MNSESRKRQAEQHGDFLALDSLPIVQRIVNAWDCCGTCAGGVLATHVREEGAADAATIADLRERLAAVEALADEWVVEGPSLVRNAYSGGDVHEGQTLERCAASLRRVLAGEGGEG